MQSLAKLSEAIIKIVFVPLLAAFPLIALGFYAVDMGYLSDAHAGFLAKSYLAADRGRLELVGFYYPPLPLLLILPFHTVKAPVLFGSLALGAVFAYAIMEALTKRLYLVALAVLFLALTPPVYQLAMEDFSQAIGLLFLWLAWRLFDHWTEEKIAAYSFMAGLFFGLAVYSVPMALPMAFLAALAAGPVRKLSRNAWAAAALVIIFPALIGALIWAYLAWTFTDDLAFLYQVFRYKSVWYPDLLFLLYAVVFFLTNRKALWELAVIGLTLPVSTLFGFGFTRGFALAFTGLFPLVNMQKKAPMLAQAALLVGAVLQFLAYHYAYPLVPKPTNEQLIQREIGKSLAQAPDYSILTDDLTTYPYIAWSETSRPYLLPADGGYEMALSAPRTFVDYIFTCPDQSRLYRLFSYREPEGFVAAWRYRGCIFYREKDAPPLP